MFGHDPIFFDLLEKQADAAHQATHHLLLLTEDIGSAAKHAADAKTVEHQADDLTHRLTNEVDSRFITPFDKGDMRALTIALDDVTDLIEAAASRITLYKITAIRSDLPGLVRLLSQVTEATRRAVTVLRNLRATEQNKALLVRVHELENQSDEAYRTALGSLFNEPGIDAVQLIKWKEVYDRIELAVDKCEDVADILEGISVKYA